MRSPETPPPARAPAPRGALRARGARLRRSAPVRAAGWAIALLVLVPGLLYAAPWLTGSDHAYLVLSGSMEPQFSPGDLVFVQEGDPHDLRVGDVVTFRVRPDSDVLVTHRVIEVLTDGDHVRYRTQGDANEDPDPFVVHPDRVVGTYRFHIPHWGLLFSLARSPVGYAVFVAAPCLALIGRHFLILYRELDAWERARGKRSACREGVRDPERERTTFRVLGLFLGAVLLAHPATALLETPALEPVNLLPARTRTTLAHLSDGEPASGWVHAGEWASSGGFPPACQRGDAPDPGPFRPEGDDPDALGVPDPGFAYDDRDCDGRFVVGVDRHVPLQDLRNGGYEAEGCLILPPSLGDVHAKDRLELTTSGNRLTIAANLTSGAALTLRTGGGPLDVWPVRLEAAESLLVSTAGGDTRLRASHLHAGEHVHVSTGGGLLDARHAEAVALERVGLHSDGGLLDLREARLDAGEGVRVDAASGRLLASNLVLDAAESAELVGSGPLDLARACFKNLGENAHIRSLDGPVDARDALLRAGENLRLQALGDVDVQRAHLAAAEHVTLDAGDARHTIRVGGAIFEDADDAAQVFPADVHVEGTPERGTIAR